MFETWNVLININAKFSFDTAQETKEEKKQKRTLVFRDFKSNEASTDHLTQLKTLWPSATEQ